MELAVCGWGPLKPNFLLVLLQLPLGSFRVLAPQLARLYPKMEVELEASPESEPRLHFTPGNVAVAPVVDVQAFALLPSSSDRKPLFQLRAKTNLSITISVDSNRIVGSVTTGSKLKLELKHSNVSPVNVSYFLSMSLKRLCQERFHWAPGDAARSQTEMPGGMRAPI
ncbi:lipopolysaccharide-binding protein-like [Sciurus carolinensis]|uniref:lipopolysaccharide-binding protein-like n=1 Tax=Sciurus carolinensis TaxID=30640 RepID=UPI001FB36F6A|nr:lipopolysaccharide-binding protein-like [Sciurus carolinensis]